MLHERVRELRPIVSFVSADIGVRDAQRAGLPSGELTASSLVGASVLVPLLVGRLPQVLLLVCHGR